MKTVNRAAAWIPAFWAPQPTVKTRIHGILLSILAMQGVLLAVLMVGSMLSHRTVARLVTDRMEPISELQTISGGFGDALAIAQKVRSGNLTPEGGLSAIEEARQRAENSWAHLAEHGPGRAFSGPMGRVEHDLNDARSTTDALEKLLKSKQVDDLDFFVSGPLYGAVDPLNRSSQALIDQLRINAEADKRQLEWILTADYLLTITLTGVAVCIGVWGIRVAARNISQPLGEIAAATKRLGIGADDEVIPMLDRSDEIGDIARALFFARQRAQEARAHAEAARRAEIELQAKERAEHRQREHRAAELDSLFARFNQDFARIVSGLAQAGGRMRSAAAAMSERSTWAERDALAAAALADQTATGIRSISVNGQALVSAIDHIRDTAVETRSSVSAVREQTVANRSRADVLEALVGEVSGALDLIDAIARQTNLLALNAAIEAARAGDAGRGFAVVAAEVKALALQTRAAAGRVDERLARMTGTAHEVVQSSQTIDGLVARLDLSAASIAVAVEQQSTASREIAHAIAYVENGSGEAASGMEVLRDRAESARLTAKDLLAIADQIASQSEHLRTEVDALVATVKAA